MGIGDSLYGVSPMDSKREVNEAYKDYIRSTLRNIEQNATSDFALMVGQEMQMAAITQPAGIFTAGMFCCPGI